MHNSELKMWTYEGRCVQCMQRPFCVKKNKNAKMQIIYCIM